MTAQLTHPAPATGPIPCTLWCEARDGHVSEPSAEQRYCYSPDERVDLSLYPPVEASMGEAVVRVPDFVAVYLSRKPGTAAKVVLEHQGRTIDLTPTEARALISALQTAVTEEGLSA